MNIQWYPGHMAKAMRKMREELKNVDVIIVMGDARVPKRSINQDFLNMIKDKKSIFVFNKIDLADDSITKQWQEHFDRLQIKAFFIDCINKKGLGELANYLKSIKQTFRFEREVRVMVAGIPNVGKSMLINTLAKRNAAQAANRPGVTRGNRWIKVAQEYYLLDTPGVLPPKFETQEDGVVISAIGSVKDTIFDREDLALELVKFLGERYPQSIKERYKLEDLKKEPLEIFEDIAQNRGFKMKRGLVDYERTSVMLLEEFKNGKIGKFTFDRPDSGKNGEIDE